MATPFRDIYSHAIFRFADYDFLQQDIATREGVLEEYLFSASVEFKHICNVDLGDYDLQLKQFNQDLDDDVIEILALGIAFYWLSYKSLDSKAIKNVLNSKD